MSLENYTTSGNILPIGLLVCAHCKDKCLKGVDFTNSQIVPGDTVNNIDLTTKESKKIPATSSTNQTIMQQHEKMNCSGAGGARVKDEVRVQPFQRQRAPGKKYVQLTLGKSHFFRYFNDHF